MHHHPPRMIRKAVSSGGISVVAGLALASGWQEYLRAFHHMRVTGIFIVLFLIAAMVMSYYFPINIRLHTKIQMTTVPLYLLTVIFAPFLAAGAVGVGTLIAEMAIRTKRKNRASNIAFQTARCILIVLPGSWIAHYSTGMGSEHTLFLICAALIVLVSDFLTFVLQQFVLFGENPAQMLVACVRDAGLSEGAQYLLGLLGALAAAQELWALVMLTFPTGMLYIACKRAKETQDGTRQLLESMADAVDLRDAYTGGHSRRVTMYTAQILKQLGLHGPEVELIVTAARVHDIGKIGIPDSVLNKPGKLTPEERALMETHSERGAELLVRYSDFARGTDIVRHHHESWDGTGYPDKLKDIEIPFGARVIAVADSFDAMTSDRPYRNGMSANKAASILRQGRDQQWDAKLVDAFLQSIADRLEQEVLEENRILESIPLVRNTSELVSNVSA